MTRYTVSWYPLTGADMQEWDGCTKPSKIDTNPPTWTFQNSDDGLVEVAGGSLMVEEEKE